MAEMIHAAFSPVNAAFTVLLLLMAVYWVSVLLGALDVDFLDVDFDGEAGGDIGDAAEASGGMLRTVLAFFYVGEVPVMVLASIAALSMWVISMIGNHYLNPGGSMLVALPLAAGNFAATAFVCKTVGIPLKRLFMVFEKDSNAARPVIGRICRIATTQVSAELGQAQIETKGAPILLNVVTEDGSVLLKGQEAVVTGRDEKRDVYTIAKVEMEK